MKKIFSKIKRIFSLESLSEKIFYTWKVLVVFRLGHFVLLPGVDQGLLLNYGSEKNLLGFLDKILSFASLHSRSVFSIGLSAYISSSIAIQILTLMLPYFKRLQQEGSVGRSRLSYITRLLTFPVSLAQGAMYILNDRNIYDNSQLFGGIYRYYFLCQVLITAGTYICIWLADCISEHGIGNGSSILIATSIISSFPRAVWIEARSKGIGRMMLFCIEITAFAFVILGMLVFMSAVRRIPLQYARLGMMDNKGIAHQYLPFPLNGTRGMSIIFAQTFSSVPAVLTYYLKDKSAWAFKMWSFFSDRYSVGYNVFLAFLVLISTFIYTSIYMNPYEIAEDLKKNKAFIPGVQAGEKTVIYIDKRLSYLTFLSAFFLAILAIAPAFIYRWFNISAEFSSFFGGTSMIIFISCILELAQQIETYITMSYYDHIAQSGEIGLKVS